MHCALKYCDGYVTDKAADMVMAGSAYGARVPLLLAAQGRCVCPAVGHAAVSLSAAAAAAFAMHDSFTLSAQHLLGTVYMIYVLCCRGVHIACW